MSLTMRLLLLLTFVTFMTQCGAANVGQPQTASPAASPKQSSTDNKTKVSFGQFGYSVPNGKGWNQLEKGTKEIFIEGFASGIVAALQRSSRKVDPSATEKLSWLMSQWVHHSIRDVIQQIDAFYSDSANLNIPVLEAYTYAFYKFEGAKEDDLNKVISQLRSEYK